MPRGGNRVESDLVGFALVVNAVWDDADTLAFDIVQITSREVKRQVTHCSNPTFAN